MEDQIIRIEDIMTTAVVALREDDALDIAGDEMALGRIRHLPVVSRDKPGRLVGLVTHRDVVRVAGRALEQGGDERNAMLQQIPVHDVMRRHVVTARSEEPAAEAARRMLAGKYGCLPVVDDAGVVVGIVTEADFVEFAACYLEGARASREED